MTNHTKWYRIIRFTFWVVGVGFGLGLAYTGRYFINSDATTYLEMGESLFAGNWHGIVNFTFSPVYAALLGLFNALLAPERLCELQVLRYVNVLCLIAAMAACEFFLKQVEASSSILPSNRTAPLPWPAFCAVAYLTFLVASLVMVRARLMNPDMLVMAVAIFCAGLILRIREDPEPYGKYALLGAAAGFGYLTKAYFFMFGPFLFLIAAFGLNSFRKAVPRFMLALAAMALVSAPLIGALSYRKGSFSWGEGGRHQYAVTIAGRGEPVHAPTVLCDNPRVGLYDFDIDCARPNAFDVTYFTIGVNPDYHLLQHAKITLWNAYLVFQQNPWLLIVFLWMAAMGYLGGFRLGPIYPMSAQWILLISAACGTGIFCLISMEPRYIAPFVFLGVTGLVTGLRTRNGDGRARAEKRALWLTLALCVFLGAIVLQSAADQTLRGLRSTKEKASYREAFFEHVAIRNHLRERGVHPGSIVAVVGSPPMYWARLSHVRILGEIVDERAFLKASPSQRAKAVESMKRADLKAVLAKGEAYAKLAEEGWRRVPGTRDYFINLL